MRPGDIIIFVNDDGETMSFIRGDSNWSGKDVNGYPSDEDIANIKQQKHRKWIHIRGGFVVGVCLGGW